MKAVPRSLTAQLPDRLSLVVSDRVPVTPALGNNQYVMVQLLQYSTASPGTALAYNPTFTSVNYWNVVVATYHSYSYAEFKTLTAKFTPVA